LALKLLQIKLSAISGLKMLLQNLQEIENEFSTSENTGGILRLLFENMTEQVHLWKLVRDKSGEIATWRLIAINPSGLASWGKSFEEVVGKNADEIFHDATTHFMPMVKRIFETGLAYSWETFFEETAEHLKMTNVPFGEYFVTTASDITEQKNTAAKAIEAQEMLEFALDGAELGTWKLNYEDGELTLGVRYCKIIGYSPHEIEPTLDGWLSYIHPDDIGGVNAAINAHTIGDTRIFESQYRFKHHEGYWVWLSTRGKITRDQKGKPLYASGVMQDISDRKRIASEGTELLKKFEQLIHDLDNRAGNDESLPNKVHVKLTSRNCEILKLLSQGLTSKEIASCLNISYQTVLTHRQTLMSILGLRNKAELIRYAIENKIAV
jgi:PAS domain S-box-containing protein